MPVNLKEVTVVGERCWITVRRADGSFEEIDIPSDAYYSGEERAKTLAERAAAYYTLAKGDVLVGGAAMDLYSGNPDGTMSAGEYCHYQGTTLVCGEFDRSAGEDWTANMDYTDGKMVGIKAATLSLKRNTISNGAVAKK